MKDLIGNRITALRTARGWSLSALAARAGIGKATLSGIEAGTRNPTMETLYAIAGQLAVPLAHLIVEPGAAAQTVSAVHGDAVSATLLETFQDPGMTTELYRLLIRAGARQTSPGHGPAVTEHLSVTAGTVLAGPAGAPLTISAGEHVRWTSDGDHTYAAVGGPAEAILLIRTPNAQT